MTFSLRLGSRFFSGVVPAFLAASITLAPGLSGLVKEPGHAAGPKIASREELGRALFFDVNLSRNRTQACATCHAPERAFTDPRELPEVGAVSLGDDGHSLGDRNAASIAYASLAPDFHVTAAGKPSGGFFHDGRAKTLEDQAADPPLNPVEMGMPDKASVVARLKENPVYVTVFDALFRRNVLDDSEEGFAAMTKAIAAFERTPEFSPFDSRYDRYLRGEATLTDEEELGRVLFFSSQFANCSRCHKLNVQGGTEKEPFTNYEYHNIGTPVHRAVRAANGKGESFIDHGLLGNPNVADKSHDGKFKVPTLRNVAVTAPYMHNGVFTDLRTVVLFYNKYNSRSATRQINPETNAPWDAPEVAENISLDELKAPALDDRRIDALVAFLKTLTDRRYEHLLDK